MPFWLKLTARVLFFMDGSFSQMGALVLLLPILNLDQLLRVWSKLHDQNLRDSDTFSSIFDRTQEMTKFSKSEK